MLKSITVNHTGRDFFGQYEMRSDTISNPEERHIAKALDAVNRGDLYAHFNYSDGSGDCVYRDGLDAEQGTWTFVHSRSWNSKDAPERISPRAARARIRAAIAEEA